MRARTSSLSAATGSTPMRALNGIASCMNAVSASVVSLSAMTEWCQPVDRLLGVGSPETSTAGTVGMVGGGQLARMTHQAAIALGTGLRVLAASPEDSAALV